MEPRVPRSAGHARGAVDQLDPINGRSQGRRYINRLSVGQRTGGVESQPLLVAPQRTPSLNRDQQRATSPWVQQRLHTRHHPWIEIAQIDALAVGVPHGQTTAERRHQMLGNGLCKEPSADRSFSVGCGFVKSDLYGLPQEISVAVSLKVERHKSWGTVRRLFEYRITQCENGWPLGRRKTGKDFLKRMTTQAIYQHMREAMLTHQRVEMPLHCLCIKHIRCRLHRVLL